MSKRKISILIALLCCLLMCCICVYMKTEDYEVDIARIQYLFQSEQEILKTYNVISSVGNNLNDLRVEEKFVSDVVVDNVESLILKGVSNIRIEEMKEEVYVKNRVAAREVDVEDIGSSNESTYEKLYRLFGSKASELRGRSVYYPNGEGDALKDMESFEVFVWDIDENGEWYQSKKWVTSNKKLVKTLKCIFSELLELPEDDRVPIKDMGCYHYREGSSAHTCGAAIDINWKENAEMTIEGVVTTGYFWEPYENIYSIKPDSPFVHIFEKYGWTWGGYWTSKKDYMHFSYIDR